MSFFFMYNLSFFFVMYNKKIKYNEKYNMYWFSMMKKAQYSATSVIGVIHGCDLSSMRNKSLFL